MCSAMFSLPVLGFALAGVLFSSAGSSAQQVDNSSSQQVEKRSTKGPWSLYCVKDDPNPQPQDCSVVAALVATEDKNVWLKVAFAFDQSPDQITMTLRTPRLNYFNKGISISTDQTHFGKAFIERCSDTYCQTTLHVDSKLLNGLATSKTATFGYQTGEEEGISLSVGLQELAPVIGELAQTLGISDQKWRPDKHIVWVELRTNPYGLPGPVGADLQGTPLKDCNGAPAAKEVVVSASMRIENERNFDEWLLQSAPCAPKSVFWVSSESQRLGRSHTMLGEASKYTVYVRLRDKVPNVVFEDTFTGSKIQRVPLQPAR
jgi:invasion protein IalB